MCRSISIAPAPAWQNRPLTGQRHCMPAYRPPSAPISSAAQQLQPLAAFWHSAEQSLHASMPAYDWRLLDNVMRNGNGGRHNSWHILRPSEAATEDLLRDQDPGSNATDHAYLLDVRCRVMILPDLAVVISSQPPAVLDLAGGCCRPPSPLAYSKLAPPL